MAPHMYAHSTTHSHTQECVPRAIDRTYANKRRLFCSAVEHKSIQSAMPSVLDE